jgi:hypothetical protein
MIPPISTLSLHPFDNGDVTPLKNQHPFSAVQYSKYKYGSCTVGEAYASALCEVFLQRFPHLALSPQLVITSSPYKAIPTSSFCIAQAFFKLLNRKRALAGVSPCRSTRIERAAPSPGDYGSLSAEQRIQRMARNRLSFDKELLAHADLVVIDDIKVTGAHQQCLTRHITQLSLASLTFLYVVECINSDSATSNPQIEDCLNHTSIRTLTDLAKIIEAPDFSFNVRVCKYILSETNRATLPAFLEQMTDHFIFHLYQVSLEDGYGDIDMYRESLDIIYDVLRQRYRPVEEHSCL